LIFPHRLEVPFHLFHIPPPTTTSQLQDVRRVVTWSFRLLRQPRSMHRDLLRAVLHVREERRGGGRGLPQVWGLLPRARPQHHLHAEDQGDHPHPEGHRGLHCPRPGHDLLLPPLLSSAGGPGAGRHGTRRPVHGQAVDSFRTIIYKILSFRNFIKYQYVVGSIY